VEEGRFAYEPTERGQDLLHHEGERPKGPGRRDGWRQQPTVLSVVVRQSESVGEMNKSWEDEYACTYCGDPLCCTCDEFADLHSIMMDDYVSHEYVIPTCVMDVSPNARGVVPVERFNVITSRPTLQNTSTEDFWELGHGDCEFCRSVDRVD
jgi:hypothetical protein